MASQRKTKEERKGRKESKNNNDSDEEQTEVTAKKQFDVEQILDYRMSPGCFDRSKGKRQVYFVVRWKGCDEHQDTIEPLTNLLPSNFLVLEFLDKMKLKLFVDPVNQESWVEKIADQSPPANSSQNP